MAAAKIAARISRGVNTFCGAKRRLSDEGVVVMRVKEEKKQKPKGAEQQKALQNRMRPIDMEWLRCYIFL